MSLLKPHWPHCGEAVGDSSPQGTRRGYTGSRALRAQRNHMSLLRVVRGGFSQQAPERLCNLKVSRKRNSGRITEGGEETCWSGFFFFCWCLFSGSDLKCELIFAVNFEDNGALRWETLPTNSLRTAKPPTRHCINSMQRSWSWFSSWLCLWMRRSCTFSYSSWNFGSPTPTIFSFSTWCWQTSSCSSVCP